MKKILFFDLQYFCRIGYRCKIILNCGMRPMNSDQPSRQIKNPIKVYLPASFNIYSTIRVTVIVIMIHGKTIKFIIYKISKNIMIL